MDLGSVRMAGHVEPECLVVTAGLDRADSGGQGTKHQREMEREYFPLMLFATQGVHADGAVCSDVQLLAGPIAQVIYAQIGVLLEELPVGQRDQAMARVAQLQTEFRAHRARDPR